MTLSRGSLLLLVYVALDFANPLMPGAVSYPNGSVQAVHVERSRMAEVPPSVTVPALFQRIELTDLLRPPPNVTAIGLVTELRLIPVQHARSLRPDSPPSSEDH